MIEFKDYYKILGLKANASTADIKSAFKKLAKQYHPDAKDGSEEKFKEINEAYEVLKDKERRNKYDLMFRYQSSINNPHTESYTSRSKKSPLGDFEDYTNMSNNRAQSRNSDSFSDFFEMLFGHYQKQTDKRRDDYESMQKGDDYEMDLELSLEEAYHGCTRKIEISGTNKNTNVRRIEVTIPAHVNEGNKIKISGEGKASRSNGPNGDLYLKIKFKKHESLHVENKFDIHQDLRIEPYEAVLGTTKTITTLAGKIDLTIPANTKSRKILRLKEKGLKDTKAKKFGDHLVHIVIDIPESISDEEKKLYQEFAKLKKPNNPI